MNVTNFIRSLLTNHDTKISTLIEGNHGIAKSAVVKQYCMETLGAMYGKENVGFIDLRLSQQDVGDLKGIPHRINGTTFFAPPNWFPVHPDAVASLCTWLESVGEVFKSMNDKPYGVLLLDEMNRATREVLQCAFELVLDRKLGGLAIPDGWQVVAAVNGNQDIYQVAQLDPALTNRFQLIPFTPSTDDWFNWAKPQVDKGVIHPAVYQYLKTHESKLDPSNEDILKASESTDQGEALFTRRSWTNFGVTLASNARRGQDLTDMDNTNDENYLAEVGKGFIGSTAIIGFITWVKTEYKTLSAKEILNSMHVKGNKTATHLRGLCKNDEIHEITALSNDLLSELKLCPDTLNDEQMGNLTTYIELIPSEAVSGFFTPWVAQGQKQATATYEWTEKRPGKPSHVADSKGNKVVSKPFGSRVYACVSKKAALAAK